MQPPLPPAPQTLKKKNEKKPKKNRWHRNATASLMVNVTSKTEEGKAKKFVSSPPPSKATQGSRFSRDVVLLELNIWQIDFLI